MITDVPSETLKYQEKKINFVILFNNINLYLAFIINIRKKMLRFCHINVTLWASFHKVTYQNMLFTSDLLILIHVMIMLLYFFQV